MERTCGKSSQLSTDSDFDVAKMWSSKAFGDDYEEPDTLEPEISNNESELAATTVPEPNTSEKHPRWLDIESKTRDNWELPNMYILNGTNNFQSNSEGVSTRSGEICSGILRNNPRNLTSVGASSSTGTTVSEGVSAL